MQDPKGRQFEIFVADFVAALDPKATVRHDVRLPDRHTGRLRQRDVWVETKLLGHFPAKILISCKDWGRKLSERDIDAFHGELLSSGAHKGIIYSSSGFTKPALEKANALGICCCGLYSDEPPDLPEVMVFRAYCLTPRIVVGVDRNQDFGSRTFGDLLTAAAESEGGRKVVLDLVMELYRQVESVALKAIARASPFPERHQAKVEVPNVEGFRVPIILRVTVDWRFYESRLEACLVQGSYNFTAGDFIGQIATPSIDMQGSSPGPGWELLDARPGTAGENLVMCVLTGAKSTEPFRAIFSTPLPTTDRA
jgi:hypothetical protein